MDIAEPPRTDPAISLREMANAIRALAMDAVERANSGHPGMPMGMADVATVLYTRFLKFDPADPAWPDRDRFVLSAGHGSMLLYALLHLTGYAGMPMEQIKRFRQWGSATPGHPEYGHTAGVETTTGPLGQGLATAVGMALAEAMLAARYGHDLVDHRTYVIAGDGCLMEGISQEAISLAGHLGLRKLVVLYDDNRISIDGATSLACSDDAPARFAASRWAVQRVDGHDPEAVAAALAAAQTSDRPTLIACRTVIGYGAPNKSGSAGVHGAALGAQEVAAARAFLGWTAAPFEIPAPVLAAWRATGARGAEAHRGWRARLAASATGERLRADLAGGAAPQLAAGFAAFKAAARAEAKPMATRIASQRVLDHIAPHQTNLVGGSADRTGSNNTRAAGMAAVTAADCSGRYLHFGVREHAMAAALNGLALHGGFIPYGGTFLAFADYCRPAIRLSALMGVGAIYVMTHDSIGLGEDGPTHQPVEHLAALRAIPNLLVLRPADAVETAEAWEIALAARTTPSVLCLTRQNLPLLRRQESAENRSARGGYLLSEPEGPRQATILASGSEVSLAVAAAEQLAAFGISCAVVSVPSMELFARQSAAYRAQILGTAPRFAIEAAIRTPWDRWIGPEGIFIGMEGFGASAPGPDLYRHFGITAERLAAAVRHRLQNRE